MRYKNKEEPSRLTVSSFFIACVECFDVETSFGDDEVVSHHDCHDTEEENLV